MTEFEQVLEDCLADLEQGASDVDRCLARHPEHAVQLKPILLLADGLGRGQALEPSAAFKARARAKLTLHMQAHPRRSNRSVFGFWRLATNLVMVALALVATGTVFAQSALPGDLFYGWKLASENVWRALSPDPVRTDLEIANRRIDELNAVASDPFRRALALEGYEEVLVRLQAELDAQTLEQILPQIELGSEPIPSPDPSIPILPLNPTETILPALPLGPTETSLPALPSNATATSQPAVINTPQPGLPEIIPTVLPETLPTTQILPTALPEILPTVEILPTALPDIIPTINIPPLLP